MGRKRRQAWSAVLALVLALTLLPPASAEETVCFTAANEWLMDLTTDTMPFWQEGELYVCHQVLNEERLGVTYSRTRDRTSVVLYRRGDVLLFDLVANTVVDSRGNSYSQPAVLRGDTVFLSADLLQSFFGLTYSYTKVNLGYLLRFQSKDAVLSDAVFLDAATSLMSYRYSQYMREKEPVTPVTPVTPVPPVVVPEERSAVMALYLEELTGASEVLTLLERQGSRVTLFLNEEQLRTEGDLLRRLSVKGHGVGLRLTESEPEALLAQAERCNGLLRSHTGSKTRLVLTEPGIDPAPLTEAGLSSFVPGVDWTEGIDTYRQRSNLVQAVEKADEGVQALLRLPAPALDRVQLLLALLKSEGYVLVSLTEVGI